MSDTKNAQSCDLRLTAFRAKKVKHAKLDRELTRILRVLENPRPESIMLLVGPSGVGKSTIVEALKRHLDRHYADELRSDPGFLPYLFVKAVTGLDGNFNWKDNLTRILMSAGDVLVNRKIMPKLILEIDGNKSSDFHSLVREELRRSLENIVANRRVRIVIIDEASAILSIRKGLPPILPFEILKSMAVAFQIPILLVGAYDLLGVLDGTGQLLRRSDIFHVERYVAGKDEKNDDAPDGELDEVQFSCALNELLLATGLNQEQNFVENFDYFMMKTVGCIGNLKDWLDKCCVEQYAKGEVTLTRKVLERNAMSNKTIIRLTREAKAGESKLQDIADAELARELALDYVPSLEVPFSEANQPSPERRKRKGRVGLRGPSRDPVGGTNERL